MAHQGEHLERGERLLGRFLRANAPGYADPQAVLFEVQRKIVLDYATAPCVIVGRAADWILREAGVSALNVFIHADDAFRAQHILTRYGETDQRIEERLREKDRARADFYEHFTGQRWGDARHFHVCLDSGALGIDTCVDILADVLREEAQHDH